jgi:CO dehydrogenase/acetyl-CoA synthase epsilon subunit
MMWETYTPAKKAQVMLLAEFLGKWAKEVTKAAKQTLLNGGAVADEAIGAAWKVKYDRAKIKINTAVACKALIDKGVDVNEIRARLTLSKDDVEELAKTVGLKGKKRTEFIETLGTRGCDVAKIERA